MFALVLLLVLYIIPKFETFLVEFNVELPMFTRAILGIASFTQANWILMLTAVFGSLVFYGWWVRTPSGRLATDRFKLRIPLVGKVINDYAQNRFTRTLGTLTSGGIPLVTALELSARAVGNVVFEQALLGVAGRVREGDSLWESLDETGLISDITIQMIKVGESTGALDEMLDECSDFTDEEIDYAARLA